MAAQLTQVCVQLHQRFTDELHAPVGTGQGGEDVVVEDEHAMHLPALAQRMVEGGMVGQAQVAPQPDQAHRVRRWHGSPVKSVVMSAETAPINLTHHFLIAMPGLEDEAFSRSVIYLCEHSERGALGLIINKPSQLTLEGLLEKVDLALGREDLRGNRVFNGGPVQTDRGFVLHDPMVIEGAPDDESAYASTMTIPGGLEMTTSKDVLEALSDGAGPKRLLVTLGYASWGEGQLESELAENAWLTVGADANVIFDTPVDDRYDRALGLLGLQRWMISPEAGRA